MNASLYPRPCGPYVLKAVYAYKSGGEAVKFDFCEEDLLISF